MTTVGHTLTGITIATAVMPRRFNRLTWFIVFSIYGMLANVPDFSLTGWGHDDYRFSHSIFVNLILIAVLLTIVVLLSKKYSLPRRLVVFAILAWLSHFLLDSFYNHGNGVAIFWPFSEAHLNMPISFFSTLESSPPPFTLHTFKVYGIEFLFYGFCFITVFLMRRFVLKRRAHSGD